MVKETEWRMCGRACCRARTRVVLPAPEGAAMMRMDPACDDDGGRKWVVQPALSGGPDKGRLRSTIRHFIVPGHRLLVCGTVFCGVRRQPGRDTCRGGGPEVDP